MGVWAMNARELTDKADQWAENAFLKLIGRIGMASAFPVLIASMTWLGSTLWALNTEQAKLAARLDVLTERIGQQLNDRYSGSDATRDKALREQKDAEQDRRIDRIERRIDRVENSRNGQGGPR